MNIDVCIGSIGIADKKECTSFKIANGDQKRKRKAYLVTRNPNNNFRLTPFLV